MFLQGEGPWGKEEDGVDVVHDINTKGPEARQGGQIS